MDSLAPTTTLCFSHEVSSTIPFEPGVLPSSIVDGNHGHCTDRLRATFGIGALTRTQIRASSMKLISAANFAYTRALTHGTTTRLVFDFDKHTFSVEEATSPVTLAAPSPDRDLEDETETDTAAVESLGSSTLTD